MLRSYRKSAIQTSRLVHLLRSRAIYMSHASEAKYRGVGMRSGQKHACTEERDRLYIYVRIYIWDSTLTEGTLQN